MGCGFDLVFVLFLFVWFSFYFFYFFLKFGFVVMDLAVVAIDASGGGVAIRF